MSRSRGNEKVALAGGPNRGGDSSRRYATVTELAGDPGAGEDAFAVIENRGLTGSNGPLRRVEGDASATIAESFDDGRRGIVLMSNFDGGTERSQ